MQWDLTGSSLGDSSKESGSSLGTRREIAGKKTGGLVARLSEVVGVCGSLDKPTGPNLISAKIRAKNSNMPIKFGYKWFSRRPGRVNRRKHRESWVWAVQPPSLGSLPIVNCPKNRYGRLTRQSCVVQPLAAALFSGYGPLNHRSPIVQSPLTSGLPTEIFRKVVTSTF
ncbi:hypothetical protein BHM03_00047102 [Ensete ventricosum]|nr:hypothetical protein BHM03_00047102 [Ensete ventricosum]